MITGARRQFRRANTNQFNIGIESPDVIRGLSSRAERSRIRVRDIVVLLSFAEIILDQQFQRLSKFICLRATGFNLNLSAF